jgi:DNA-binding transcriptional ArsR family regulator
MKARPKPSDSALDALGNPIRRELLERLADGPMSVGELAAGLPISRPAVSRHLATLKRAGLVVDRSSGSTRLYALNQSGFSATRQWLESFWSEAGIRFRLVADNLSETKERGGD